MEYKTTRFEHFEMYKNNYQGTAMMNYTDKETPFTRVIEHKHFECIDSEYTYVTFEYPAEYKPEVTEPYYPVNDEENSKKYLQYKNLAEQEKNIIFGGRLAEYKYYDMHQVIESALNKVKELYENNIQDI